MRNTKIYMSGQIMVIVLLILSVLSIIAVSTTLTTTRDTKEQIQDKQYQQYYTVGERNIMDMIRHLGRDAISTLLSTQTIGGLTYTCSDISNGKRCTIGPISNTYYNLSGTQEVLTTVMDIQDYSSLSAGSGITIELNKDQDLVFDLSIMTSWTTIPGKTMRFGWEGGNAVSWNISYDCYDPINNLYKTAKYVWDNSAGVNYTQNNTAGGSSSPYAYFSVAAGDASPIIIINTGSSCTSANAQFLRLKPVTDNDTVKLTELAFNDSNVPLIRKISTITTSLSNTSMNNASAVLETTYFLGESPLSLFDYVLRTEGDVIKD